MAKLPPKHLGCLASSLKRCAWTKYFLGKCQNLLKENSTELFYSCTICNACLEILMRNSGLLATQLGCASMLTHRAVCAAPAPRRANPTPRSWEVRKPKGAASAAGRRRSLRRGGLWSIAVPHAIALAHTSTSPAELYHFLWFHQRLESPKGVESLPKRHN